MLQSLAAPSAQRHARPRPLLLIAAVANAWPGFVCPRMTQDGRVVVAGWAAELSEEVEERLEAEAEAGRRVAEVARRAVAEEAEGRPCAR